MERKDAISDTAFVFNQMLKMKRRQMKPKVRDRTRRRDPRQTWLYPHAQERVYRDYITRLMKVFTALALPTLKNNLERWLEEIKADTRTDDFNTELQRLIRSLEELGSKIFSPGGTGVTDDKGDFYSEAAVKERLTVIGSTATDFNRKQWEKITKEYLGEAFAPDEFLWLQPAEEAWKNTNFELIKSMSDEYIKKLNTIVSEGVMDGKAYETIMKEISAMDKNMTKSRAALLARDQVGKLNGRLAKRRQQEAGVNMYKWLTAFDERVRGRPGGRYPFAKPSHWALHNKICQWGDDTVYKDTTSEEERWKKRSTIGAYIGPPGSAIQCRCSPVPVFREMIEEVDKELHQESQIMQ